MILCFLFQIYIKYFSEALRVEYQKHGITVQHIAPAFVSTKMNDFSFRVRNKSFFVPDANQYAKSAVSLLGVTDTSTGFWVHGIQVRGYLSADILNYWPTRFRQPNTKKRPTIPVIRELLLFFLIYKKASWIFLNIGTYKLNLNAGTYIGTNLFLLNFGLCENTNGGF